jgi:hypothetical protein
MQDGGKYWLVNGQHRLEAARLCRLPSISCEIRKGDRRAGLLASVGVNATHGLRRTNVDKRRAVAKLLDDSEWSEWSAREIARRCRVSDGLVADMQAERAAAGEVTADSRSEKAKVVRYTHKHGKPTVMKIKARTLRIDPAMEKGRYFREAVEQLLGFKAHGVLDDPPTAVEILANSDYDLDRVADAIDFIRDALDDSVCTTVATLDRVTCR